MQFAFSSNAFTNFSLIDSITEISKIGYTGVELMCDKPHAYPPTLGSSDIVKIKNTLNSHKIQISNLNAFTLFALGDTYHPSWIESDPDARKARIEHTKNCLHLAAELGAKTISIEPGGPVERSETSREKLYKVFSKGINEVLPIAEAHKIKILIEPEPGLLLQTSKEYLDFMKNFDSEFIKLNFDIGHFYCVKENPSDLVNELDFFIEHYHLADIKDHIHNHLIPGLGDINIKDVLHTIIDSGYKGFVTVELYPYKDDPVAAATKSLDYIRNLMA